MDDDAQSETSLPRNIADDPIEIIEDAAAQTIQDQQIASAPPADDTDDSQVDFFRAFRHQGRKDRSSSAPPAKRPETSTHYEGRRSPPSTSPPDVSTIRTPSDDDETCVKRPDGSLGEVLDEISKRFQETVRVVSDKGTQSTATASAAFPASYFNRLFESKIDRMDSAFAPKPFKGQVGDDVETFLQEFDKFVEYRELTDDKAVALLKLLLKEGAGEWLSRLDEYTRRNLRGLRAAVQERYGRSKIVKHKTARELFARKQGPDEDVETFISACIKLSTSFGAESESMAMYAIMGGLRPQLATYVAQKQPENLKQLIDQTRLAEMTLSPVSDQPMIQQMSEMKAEIQRLGSQLEKATTAQVRSTSPSDARRVRFDDKPRRRQSPNNYRQRESRAVNNYPRKDSQQKSSSTEQQPKDCTRCGYRGGHDHPNRCRAYNQSCRYCDKIGHFARCCRKAKYDQRARADNQE